MTILSDFYASGDIFLSDFCDFLLVAFFTAFKKRCDFAYVKQKHDIIKVSYVTSSIFCKQQLLYDDCKRHRAESSNGVIVHRCL